MKKFAWILGPSSAEAETFKSLENILRQLGQEVRYQKLGDKCEVPEGMDAITLGTKGMVKQYWVYHPHAVLSHDIIDLPSAFGRKNLLNDNVTVCKGRDIPWNGEELFIKESPVIKGFASFPSGVYSQNTMSSDFDDHILHVSPIKKILSETRFFVLDGKIIGSSKYALGQYMVKDMPIAPVVSEFAANMVARAPGTYVLDIAFTEDGSKVIEVNTFNSSGLFGIDMYVFATAVNDYMERNPPKVYSFYATVTTHSSPIEAEVIGTQSGRSEEQAIKNLQRRKRMVGDNFLYRTNGKWYYAGAEIFTDKQKARHAYMQRERLIANSQRPRHTV